MELIVIDRVLARERDAEAMAARIRLHTGRPYPGRS
jgi:hypothetical protein